MVNDKLCIDWGATMGVFVGFGVDDVDGKYGRVIDVECDGEIVGKSGISGISGNSGMGIGIIDC